LLSVDVARGITMVFMIMIDNQGGGKILWPFRETEWDGLTTADTVFPTFLFILGVSMVLALSRHSYAARQSASSDGSSPRWASSAASSAASAPPRGVWSGLLRRCWPWPADHLASVLRRILVRAAKLFVIGALLNLWAGGFSVSTWHYLGVLQRLAVCYAGVALLYVLLPLWALRLTAAACVVSYNLIMYLVRPGAPCLAGQLLSPFCNAAACIDRQVVGPAHMFADGFLPEGLVSTLPALVTSLLGLEYGLVLQGSKRAPAALGLKWLAGAALMALAGGLGSLGQPVVKKIYTTTFMCLVGAVSGGLLSACVFLVDVPWCARGGRGARGAGDDARRDEDEATRVALLADSNDVVRRSLDALPLDAAFPSVLQGHFPGINGSNNGPDAAAGDAGKKPRQQNSPPGRLSVPGLPTQLLAPLIWLGRNPAVVFIGMVALEILLLDTLKFSCTPGSSPECDAATGKKSAWGVIYWKAFASWIGDNAYASSAVGLAHLVFWTLLSALLFRANIFISL
jgi:predicted acyltransferase